MLPKEIDTIEKKPDFARFASCHFEVARGFPPGHARPRDVRYRRGQEGGGEGGACG